jgi:dephospho-CoA kinase
VLRVGLTGNVASGKSSVAALWRSRGAVVIDADVLAREALEAGGEPLARVAGRFGRDLLLNDGSLDRAALRRRVMGDPAARADLNAIVHPLVAARGAELEARARAAGAPVVVHDIPLLFEVLDPSSFDAVVLVDAPPSLRRSRLLADRGLGPAEADELIAAQQPSAAKRAGATFVIDNAGTRQQLEERAAAVWTELLARAGAA